MTNRSRGSSRKLSGVGNRPQLMIFSEGKKTESLYLTNWYRLYRDRVILSLAPHAHTTPFELAQAARDKRAADLKDAKRGRGRAYSQYWCVFDVDEHPKISEAFDLARANNINIALSSPCLELWFVLHFENRTAFLDRKEAQKLSRALLGCEKVLTQAALDLLVQNYETAKKRAQDLERKHIGDDSPQPWNPHSDTWKLIDSIRSPESIRSY